MRYPLPEYVRFILETLHRNGHGAYAVGGCVRDLLAGITPHDYDVATDALPETVQQLFERTVATGLKHGTVTVIVSGNPVEVTTYRTESGYSDGRRPDGVRFVGDLREDLRRRDFTVNAMAYNDREGLIDPFEGQNDMKRRILRAVGDPYERFREDALRILRLFRFASTLGFTPEEKTAGAALECAPNLARISRERIASELKRAVGGDDPAALTPLLRSGALAFAGIPDCGDLSAIALLKPSERLRFYALLLLCGCDADDATEALRCSGEERRYCHAMQGLGRDLPDRRTDIKRTLRAVGEEVFFDHLTLLESLYQTDVTAVRESAHEILTAGEPYLLRHLAVGGADLQALGITGTETGQVLTMLLEAVTEEPARNDHDTLLTLAEEYSRKNAPNG